MSYGAIRDYNVGWYPGENIQRYRPGWVVPKTNIYDTVKKHAPVIAVALSAGIFIIAIYTLARNR